MSEDNRPSGPDLAQGVSPDDFADGKLLGHVGEEQVLLVQVDVQAGAEVLAIDAFCSHYHGPLAEGLVVGDGIRCPWHHACFSLRSGEAVRPPALSALAVWQVEREGDRIFVRRKREAPKETRKETPAAARPAGAPPRKIVIVGGGAAGFAAADMLRREGFAGTISMISDDAAPHKKHRFFTDVPRQHATVGENVSRDAPRKIGTGGIGLRCSLDDLRRTTLA